MIFTAWLIAALSFSGPSRHLLAAAQEMDPMSTMHCSYRGHMDMASQKCQCMSGFTGPDCSQRLCDVGRAWADYGSADGVAHAKWTECSSMGYCDRAKGECECRKGFEGAACQYLACPKGATNGKVCSDHGKCYTMREAASKYDGRSLTRPSVKYDNWDADQIQGCVCDEGFSGYDCSVSECPRGDDPNTDGQQNEVLQVSCRATAGYWFLSFKGETSRPIPFDAGYGTVERILEDMGSIDDVSVTFSNTLVASTSNAPSCGDDYENVMFIEFLNQFGPLPPARVDGSRLNFGVNEATGALERGVLEMVSSYSITCGPGAKDGSVYFVYDGQPSEPVSFNSGEVSMKHALERIPTLGGKTSSYGNATVEVQMSGSSTASLCSEFNTHVTNVTIRGAYGNLLPLTVINSLHDRAGHSGERAANLTVLDNRGNKENLECNGRGTCDYASGTCRCDQLLDPGTTKYRYRYASSDGYGAQGGRGDCGFAKAEPLECPSVKGERLGREMVCAGRGVCNNATFTCECFDGFSGSACTLRDCPSGPAWFDEATSTNVAHALSQCSGRGRCDTSLGECVCDENFEGTSCQRLKCPDVPDGRGNPCSGHGRCLSMWRLGLEAQDEFGVSKPVTYGDADDALSHPKFWDRDMVQGCHCDSRNDMQPYDGPVGLISGIQVSNPKVGGWTGYDCSRRWCPTGDDPLTSKLGNYEVQTIACNNLTASNTNFTLTFRQQTTKPISPRSSAKELELLLEELSTIGDVEVDIPGAGNDPNATVCDEAFGYSGPSFNASGQERFVAGGFRGVQVRFLTELGDLPLLIALPQDPKQRRDGKEVWAKIAVNETVKGTKENAECSNRGMCDYSTGECMCMPGFSGSAGNQSTGLRRDCGRRSEDGFTLNPYY